MKDRMNTRTKKHHYLPTQDGGFVRKSRDQLTAQEQAFVRETKGLEGRNQEELDKYQAAARKLFR